MKIFMDKVLLEEEIHRCIKRVIQQNSNCLSYEIDGIICISCSEEDIVIRIHDFISLDDVNFAKLHAYRNKEYLNEEHQQPYKGYPCTKTVKNIEIHDLNRYINDNSLKKNITKTCLSNVNSSLVKNNYCIADQVDFKYTINNINYNDMSDLKKNLSTASDRSSISDDTFVNITNSNLKDFTYLEDENAQNIKKEIHSEKKEYLCTICDLDFNLFESLKLHLHEIHQFKNICDLCFAGFKSDNELIEHINKIHFNEEYINNSNAEINNNEILVKKLNRICDNTTTSNRRKQFKPRKGVSDTYSDLDEITQSNGSSDLNENADYSNKKIYTQTRSHENNCSYTTSVKYMLAQNTIDINNRIMPINQLPVNRSNKISFKKRPHKRNLYLKPLVKKLAGKNSLKKHYLTSSKFKPSYLKDFQNLKCSKNLVNAIKKCDINEMENSILTRNYDISPKETVNLDCLHDRKYDGKFMNDKPYMNKYEAESGEFLQSYSNINDKMEISPSSFNNHNSSFNSSYGQFRTSADDQLSIYKYNLIKKCKANEFNDEPLMKNKGRQVDISSNDRAAQINKLLNQDRRHKDRQIDRIQSCIDDIRICPVCHKMFKDFSAVELHCYNYHHQYPCRYCTQSFTQRVNRDRHLFQHTGDQQFYCDTCGLGFTQKESLLKHILRSNHRCRSPNIEYHKHIGEQGLDLTLNSKFNDNLININEISDSCDLNSSFSTQNCRYRCDRCGNRFNNGELFSNHCKIEHRRTPCLHCGKTFSQKGNMERHKRQHTGERPFQCAECSACYTRRETLKAHMLQMHSCTTSNILEIVNLSVANIEDKNDLKIPYERIDNWNEDMPLKHEEINNLNACVSLINCDEPLSYDVQNIKKEISILEDGLENSIQVIDEKSALASSLTKEAVFWHNSSLSDKPNNNVINNDKTLTNLSLENFNNDNCIEKNNYFEEPLN